MARFRRHVLATALLVAGGCALVNAVLYAQVSAAYVDALIELEHLRADLFMCGARTAR